MDNRKRAMLGELFLFPEEKRDVVESSLKRWHKIDGFIANGQDRHELKRSFKVGELKPLLSDHRPVEVKLKVTSIKTENHKAHRNETEK